MEPVRKLLYVPANPCGQGAVLIVVIHGSEVTPRVVATGKLHNAVFKVDAEPFPLKKKQAETRRGRRVTQAGPQAGWRKKERDETGFHEHAIRLEAGEILRGGDERQKTNQAYRQRQAWPEIKNNYDRSYQSNPCDQQQGTIAGAEPEQSWRKPEALQPRIIICNVAQIARRRQDAVGADHALELEEERVERGKIDNAQAAEKDPARQQMRAWTFSRSFRPQQPFGSLFDIGHLSPG